jgi:serine/threonine-protein kinase RsbT
VDPSEKIVPVSKETDIVMARIAGAELADRLGFGTIDKHCIITSISELAANIFFFAGEGTVTVRAVTPNGCEVGLEVVAQDEGPGIEDVELAMQDGCSTNGGLGGGLPGVNRLMSEMEITSGAGRGTLVRAVKWLGEDKYRRPSPPAIGAQRQ